MILTHRPIQRWPRELTGERRHTPFKATWTDTLQLLDRELRYLDAKNVVLMVAVSERDCRMDGQLRADARPEHPGVILAFDSKHGSMQYPSDTFTHWQANVRAIALGLMDLRRLDRYGIVQRGEQYTGWKQLDSGIALGGGFTTRDEAARFLVKHATDGDGREMYEISDVDSGTEPGPFLMDAFRVASKRMHPDAGGDPEIFGQLVSARDRLGRD